MGTVVRGDDYTVKPLKLHGLGGSKLYAGQEVIQVINPNKKPTKKDMLKTVIECCHYDLPCAVFGAHVVMFMVLICYGSIL